MRKRSFRPALESLDLRITPAEIVPVGQPTSVQLTAESPVGIGTENNPFIDIIVTSGGGGGPVGIGTDNNPFIDVIVTVN